MEMEFEHRKLILKWLTLVETQKKNLKLSFIVSENYLDFHISDELK